MKYIIVQQVEAKPMTKGQWDRLDDPYARYDAIPGYMVKFAHGYDWLPAAEFEQWAAKASAIGDRAGHDPRDGSPATAEAIICDWAERGVPEVYRD